MKQVQSVLWCAMVKVSPLYSINEFEEDFKINLAKCALQMKEKNDEKSTDGTDMCADDSHAETKTQSNEVIEHME